MPSLETLTLEQRHALRTAAAPCTRSSRASSGPRPSSCSSHELRPVRRQRQGARLLAAPRRAIRPSAAQGARPASRARRTTVFRSCCSCACTMPVVRRWRSAGSTISPAIRPSRGRVVPSPAPRSIRRPSRRWPRSASTSRGVPQAVDRRDRAGGRRGGHDGMRRRVSALPGQALRGLGARRPRGKDVEAVRPIRDEIERRVRDLLTSLNVTAR